MNNFFNDFVRVFKTSKVEQVGILPVYKVAGRDDTTGKSSEDLVKAINGEGEKAVFLKDYDEAKDLIRRKAKKGDIVFFSIADYGHVSICVNSNIWSLLTFDENWPLTAPCKLINHSYIKDKVLGWLHANNVNIQ